MKWSQELRAWQKVLVSFIEGGAANLGEIIRADDHVDRLNRVVIGLLHDLMREDPDFITLAVHCFSSSRHLERIVDLTEDISEEVIYLVKRDIVRHQHGEFATSRDAQAIE
jgi:phosphate transport system protein